MEDCMTFALVKEIIDAWDPIELLVFAPEDEYDEESMRIFKRYTDNVENLGDIIFDVFQTAFEDTFTKKIQECVDVASLIINHS